MKRENFVDFLDFYCKADDNPVHKWKGECKTVLLELTSFKWLYYASDIDRQNPPVIRNIVPKRKSIFKPSELWTDEGILS